MRKNNVSVKKIKVLYEYIGTATFKKALKQVTETKHKLFSYTT